MEALYHKSKGNGLASVSLFILYNYFCANYENGCFRIGASAIDFLDLNK